MSVGEPRDRYPTLIHGPAGSEGGARYEVYGEIGSGGMATVQYGRLLGGRGFARAVAIKRLHPQFLKDHVVVGMFVDEARLSARLAHANIVPTLDVIEGETELAIVMEYVHGESLSQLLELAAGRGEPVPIRVATALIAGVLQGLHAAHEACGELGEALRIVHRDVSPQNVLVGADGIARVLDFGIAKAAGRLRITPRGEVMGKVAYMAPEQLRGGEVDRAVDIYAAAAVLWEVLCGMPLFDGPNTAVVLQSVLSDAVDPPSQHRADVPEALDRTVMRGLDRDRCQRFATAREMALALENEVGSATQSQVAEWLQGLAGAQLAARTARLRQMQDVGAADGGSRPVRKPSPAPNTRQIETVPHVVTPAPPPSRPSSGKARVPLTLWATLALLAGAVAIWLATATAPAIDVAGAPQVRPAQPTPAPPEAPAPETEPPGGLSALPTAASAPQPETSPAATPIPVRPAPVRPRSASQAGPERPRNRVAKSSAPVELPASPTGPTKREVAAAPREAEPDCEPPYTIDRLGIRRPKPQCLGD